MGGNGITVAYCRARSRRNNFKDDNAVTMDMAALTRRLILLGFCLLISTGLSCSNAHTPRDLIGTWQGESSQMSAVVVKFEGNGTFHFRYTDPNGASKLYDCMQGM